MNTGPSVLTLQLPTGPRSYVPIEDYQLVLEQRDALQRKLDGQPDAVPEDKTEEREVDLQSMVARASVLLDQIIGLAQIGILPTRIKEPILKWGAEMRAILRAVKK